MAPILRLVLGLGLTASIVTGYQIRLPRDVSGATSGSGAGSFAGAGASSGSFSSSSGTKVAPGPGGYGNFNAFAANTNLNRFADEPETAETPYRGTGTPQQVIPRPTPSAFPFFFPPFNPYVPQYGQQYPFVPFPTFAPFDFSSFLNNYFQQFHQFQAQAEAQAQQAAASGHGIYHKGPNGVVYAYSYPRSLFAVPFTLLDSGYSTDTNEVGASGIASYSPQGGYGSASVFPAPPGGLETRFGADGLSPNALPGGPVTRVSGSFGPPGSNSYGVFSSSMSGSSDINGKKTSFKQSTIGVNDNGKVTTYTAHDP